MAIRFSNNARSTLASGITASATSITVADGSVFPALAPGDHTYVTLEDVSGNLEVVKVTAISSNTLTVIRGQDGTTARAYSSGDFVQLRVTAALLNDLADEASVTLWADVQNKPDPVITLAGDATGSATLTDLGSATLTVTIADDSHNHTVANVDGLQAALDAKQNASTALTTSTTFGGDVSGTYNAIVIADDSHNHVISNVDGLQAALDSKLAVSSYTAADVLAKLITVDGASSGLDADLLDGVQGSNHLRMLSAGTEANLDSYTDNGVRAIAYSGYSKHLLSWNAYGSPGTVQQEFHYDPPANGWRIRGKTDNTTWGDWGYVVTASANQGRLTGTVWHSGNDGSGSGLDADTVDGIHSSGIHLVTTDPNTPSNGTISIGSNGSYTYVQSHAGQPLRLNPLGNPLQGPSGSTIWHSGNDGSGSGLDADLLDGQHGSYYAPASSLSGYVAKTGDTMSGNLTVPQLYVTEDGHTLTINPHALGVDLHSTGNIAPHFQTSFALYTGAIGSGSQKLYLNSSGDLTVTGSMTASGGNSNQWNSAYTYSQVGHLPISGGTLTGTLSFQQPVGLNFANGQYIKDNGGGGLAIYSGAAIDLNSASGAVSVTGNSIIAGSGSSGAALTINRGSDGAQALQVYNTGEVVVGSNYFYVSNSAGAYFTGAIRARGGISNDQGDLSLDDNVTVTGTLQVNGATTLSSGSNHYQGHFYYDPYDSNGNHYPHFLDGANGNGVDINWRLFTGASNSHTHIWTTNQAYFSTILASGIDVRGPRFYDWNDTNFYLDPAGTSNLAAAIFNGAVTMNSSLNVASSIGIAGTTAIDSSRNLTNIGTISSGAIAITHTNLGAEPYSGLTITNTSTSGAYFTGVTVDAVGQSHYRYKLNGALKWQTRVGAGSGTDDFRVYSWTGAADVLLGNPSGQWTATGDFRAPIFYDSNDTSFYVDPNGTSRINVLATTGGTSTFYNGRIALRADGIEDHQTAGDGGFIQVNYYGYQNGHSYFRNFDVYNGKGGTALSVNGAGNYTQINGSTRSPIFYDSNNTSFFTDPSATSQIRKTNLFALGSAWDDGLNLYSSDLTNRWNLLVDNGAGDSFRLAFNNSEAFGVGTNGEAYFTAGLRAQLYYDRDDTGYYVDPNVNSFLNGPVTINGNDNQLRINGTSGSKAAGLFFQQDGASKYELYYYSGQFRFYNYARAAQEMSISDSGVVTVHNDFRAPIMYDVNDTSRRVDPNGTSELANVNVNNVLEARSGSKIIVQNSTDGGTSRGLFLWNSSDANWGIYMSTPGAGKTIAGTTAPAGLGGVIASHAARFRVAANSANGFIWENSSNATLMSLQGDAGNLYTSHSVRSPIFYDSNDTSFYLDPNSNSLLRTVYTQNGSYHFRPRYTDGSDIYSGSFNWYGLQLGNNGTNYIVAGRTVAGGALDIYVNNTSDFPSINGTHSSRFESNGIFYNYHSVRSPLFYDYNDTNYYVDPASSSVLQAVTMYGRTRIGGEIYISAFNSNTLNSGFTHGGNGSDIWINYRGYNDGQDYTRDFRVGNGRGSQVMWVSGSGSYVEATNDFRAPIFYDSDNTGYYVDPAGATSAKFAQFVQIGDSSSYGTNSGSWGARLNVTDNVHAKIEVGQDADGMLSHWYAHTGQSSVKFGTQSSHDLEIQRGSTQKIYIGASETTSYNPLVISANWGTGSYSDALTVYGTYPSITLRSTNANGGTGQTFLMHTDSSGTIQYYFDTSGPNESWGKRHEFFSDGRFYAPASVRSPIFYDMDNTGYYVDPASGSYINSGTAVGSWNFTASSYCLYAHGNGNTASVSGVGAQIYSSGGNGALLAFHRGGYYAVNMGLDSDNVLRIGGWSAGANRFQLDMSGNLTVAGNVTAYSDIRLKEDIEVIPEALSKVRQIRGVTFTRNDQEDKEKRHTGVIAQEVELVLPEVVSEDNEGVKNVAYGNMVGLLIEAIKEQQTQIEAMAAKIKSLKEMKQ
jgi:hypothetical protein